MSSIYNNNTFTGGAYVYLYENQEQNVEQLIQQALQPYITTQQAVNIFLSKSAFDNSYNEILNIINNINIDFDTSFNFIINRLDLTDISLNNERIRNDNQDISINNIELQIIDIDTSINILDVSLNNEKVRNDIQDVSINILDVSLNNEIARNDIQDTSINNLQTSLNNLNVNIDASLNLKVNKAGDTMTGNLNMNNNKITNLLNPTDNGDAVNLTTLNTQSALKVSKAGDSMTGNLTSTAKITSSQMETFNLLLKDIFNSLIISSINSTNNNSNSYVNRNTLKIENGNNAMYFYTSAVLDDRKSLIQVGHRDSANASLLGDLLLNGLGGNVGIGTLSPSFKLDVNGNSRVSGTLEISNGTATNHAITLSQLNGIEDKFDTFNILNFTRTRTYADRLSTDTGGGVFTQHTLNSRRVGTGTYNIIVSIVFYSTFSTTIRFLIEAYREGDTPSGDFKVITPFIQTDADTSYSGGIITNGSIYTITMPFTNSVSQGNINSNLNSMEIKIRPNPSTTTAGHEIRFNCKITTERVATSDWN